MGSNDLWRHCPGCGFIAPVSSLSRLRIDVTCPRCGRYKASEFRLPVLHARPKLRVVK